jgi:hypothetical protein
MGLPALQEFRALTVFEALPPGCLGQLIPTDKFAPHLKRGEIAVIDTEDREPIQGEIYLVRIMSSRQPEGFRRTFVQITSRTFNFVTSHVPHVVTPGLGWMMHFQMIKHRPRRLTREEVLAGLRDGSIGMCDGPLNTDYMREKIIGRVVGVIL